MKLLVFSPAYPPHVGGLETHAAEFNHHLAKDAVIESITVFTPRLVATSPAEEVVSPKMTVIRFPAWEIIPNYALPKYWDITFWRLLRRVVANRSDIIISRTRFFHTSLLAGIVAKWRGFKWVHIEHGSDFVQLNNRFTSGVARLYDRVFGRFIFLYSDRNIAISVAAADFVAKFVSRPCTVIYRGVEVEQIKAAKPRTDLQRRYKNYQIITFIGRLIDGKGVLDLLAALAQLQHRDVKCLIVGEGPQRARLEEKARELGLHDAVIFMGEQPFQDAIGILKIANIFVNPSYTEGLPTAVVEAALCRKAIIATDVGGTREIIEDKKSGFLVSPRNVSQLVRRLEQYLTHPDLQQAMGEAAYEQVSDRFSWARSCDTYKKVFHTILQMRDNL